MSGVRQSGDVLRAAVIGAGYFGRFHAEKLAAHRHVRLMAVADPDIARLVDVAAACGAQAYGDYKDVLGAVDLVSIATPARLHALIAREALQAGAHVLIEKPLATRLDEADALIALADAKKLVVQVGHQERAVLERAGLLAVPARPRAIICIRKGPATGRGLDADAALDLMTHDLDLAHALNPAAIERVAARGDTDALEAQLTLADGCKVQLSASRRHHSRERSMQIDYETGRIGIDFLARRIDNATPYSVRDLFESDDEVTVDPLGFALDRFLRAIETGGKPLVSAQEARWALAGALAIAAALKDASHAP